MQKRRKSIKKKKKKEENTYRKPGSSDDCPSQTQLLRLPNSESKSSNLFYPPAGSPDKEDCNRCVPLSPILQVSLTYAYLEEGENERCHSLSIQRQFWHCACMICRHLRVDHADFACTES